MIGAHGTTLPAVRQRTNKPRSTRHSRQRGGSDLPLPLNAIKALCIDVNGDKVLAVVGAGGPCLGDLVQVDAALASLTLVVDLVCVCVCVCVCTCVCVCVCVSTRSARYKASLASRQGRAREGRHVTPHAAWLLV